jgi:DNA-binding ferritin-like protein (Dps family)
MSETETNFGIELQAMRKAMADVQGTDYAMKCRALETKLQQMESTHKAEVLGLQEQLNKLLESACTQTRALPEVTGE